MITGTDLKLFRSSVMATNFSDSNIGGGIDVNQVTGSSPGEVLFSMEANAIGGASLVQYGKLFDKNDNATDPANGYGVFLSNALDDFAVASSVTFTPSDPADTDDLLAVGFDGSGNPITEKLTRQGTTPVVTSGFFIGNFRVYSVDASGATVPSQSVVSVEHNGATVGQLPLGQISATNEIDIGLSSALDDTETIADASTAPAGVTFSRPRSEAEKLIVIGGSLPAQSAQGIWVRWTLQAGMPAGSAFKPLIEGA